MSLEKQFADASFPIMVEKLSEREAKELVLMLKQNLDTMLEQYRQLYFETKVR